jgi:excisionase family DNA binding protein
MREKYFLTGEIAHKYDVSPKTIRDWIEAGKLKVDMIIGGKRVISESALAEFDQQRAKKIASKPLNKVA